MREYDIKPIPTIYNGIEFRSRLEARWAVFFDQLCIKWAYELEGYELSDGTKYLPDFWLPTFNGGMYVEVKPDDLTKYELKKACLLCAGSKRPVWLAIGPPFPTVYKILMPDHYRDNEPDWVADKELNIQYEHGVPNFDQAEGEDRMYVSPGYTRDVNNLQIPSDCHDSILGCYKEISAVALSTRFVNFD